MKRKLYSHNQGGISLAGLLCLFGTFLVSGSLFWLAAPDRSTVSKDKAEFISAPISQGAEQEVGYCPISQIELGQRTLGTNPLREEVPENLQDPDPTFWREVHLQVADESQEEVTIQLLRPLGWIYAQNAWLGNKIPLELTELHVNGEAVVTYVGSCPPIQPGPGNVVTGKYIHQSADNLIDLSIEGENQPTGVTTNHPYWSVDRQCFLQAGDLKRGEHVETRYGPRQVVSLTPRGNQPVYNLEVHGEHVYRVGTLGTLVHNKAMKVNSPPAPISRNPSVDVTSSNVLISQFDTLQPVVRGTKSAYEVASEGGKHAGFLKNYINKPKDKIVVCFSKTGPIVMKVLSVLLTRRTFDEQAKKTSQPRADCPQAS